MRLVPFVVCVVLQVPLHVWKSFGMLNRQCRCHFWAQIILGCDLLSGTLMLTLAMRWISMTQIRMIDLVASLALHCLLEGSG